MSISPDFSASKRVLPVVGVYFTREESPKTAAATPWQTAGSKPTQLPASSVKAKPATPVETPHWTCPLARTSSSVPAKAAVDSMDAAPAANRSLVIFIEEPSLLTG
jgi:hypothetical protein